MSETGFISGSIADRNLPKSGPAMYAATKKGAKKGGKKGIRDSRITCPGVQKPAKKK
ncbi:MAG TPA: hypothetical protein VGF40_00255 [Thermoanaerobaculia bacterium]